MLFRSLSAVAVAAGIGAAGGAALGEGKEVKKAEINENISNDLDDFISNEFGFDKQGNDNTLSLQELTNIRLRFDDLGIVNFHVLTISEYPDYYLYRIANVTFGNSTEKFKSPTNPISSTNTYTLTAGINNASPIFYGYTDTTGSINGNGLYDFVNGGYTVTITCYFSASAFPVTFTESFYLIFTGSNGEVNKQLFYPYLGSPGTRVYSASISYVPTSGSTLGEIGRAHV